MLLRMILWRVNKDCTLECHFWHSFFRIRANEKSNLINRGDHMSKLNQEAAPNLNLNKKNHAFSEELADGGERDEIIAKQRKRKKK